MRRFCDPEPTTTRLWSIYELRAFSVAGPRLLAFFRGTEAELVAFIPMGFEYTWSYD